MAIYTKTGDKGSTSLANGDRISKADARIEAYGTVDELNSWIGLLRAALRDETRWIDVDAQLRWLQNKLFNLGAALSLAPGEWVSAEDAKQVEQWIDAMQAEVPKQHAFLLPAGGEAVCRCHVCRTICRRAERRMIAVGCAEESMQLMNRISDYLFVLARYIGFCLKEPEEVWQK
jgi:ATP:cob(I)alamin adenosyltransferase